MDNLKEEMLKGLLEVVKDGYNKTKKEAPKVIQDLLTEGLIDNISWLVFQSILILNGVGAALSLLYTPIDYDHGPTLHCLYISISLVAAFLAIIGAFCCINDLLIIKKAPRAYLLNKVTELLSKDD